MPASRPPVVKVLLQGLSTIIPPIVLAEVFVIGLFPTLWHMIRHPRSIPFPNRWRDSFHHAAQPLLLAMSDSVFRDQKRQLIAQAKGRVLEVGAGTGCTLKYYDKDNVEMVYGVEPDLPVLNRLEKEVAKRDLIGKYKILPFGIDDTDKMTEAEITPGSIDTVVLCLCSVPTPEQIMSALYSYLKPGGTLLVLEHVRSEYRAMRFLQTLYTKSGWRYLMGCELNRPTVQLLLNSEARQEWAKVELMNPEGEGWWSLMPMIIGKLVKA